MKQIIGIILSLFILSSCSKYEEGPGINFVGKKERVTNKWTPVNTYINGIDRSHEYEGDVFEMSREGKFTLITKYNEVFHGDWEFTNEKRNVLVRMYYPNTESVSEVIEWEIIKLRKSQLWLKATINGVLYEHYFEPIY